MLRLYGKILAFSHEKCDFKVILAESNICAPILQKLLNLLQRRDKMLKKCHNLSLFLKLFNKFNNT